MKSPLLYSLPWASVLLPAIHGAPTGGNPPLRGSEDLLGYAASNTVTDQTTDDIPYVPVPGQTEAADVGVYLDFEDAENPQPVRGDVGGTDPGPRMGCRSVEPAGAHVDPRQPLLRPDQQRQAGAPGDRQRPDDQCPMAHG